MTPLIHFAFTLSLATVQGETQSVPPTLEASDVARFVEEFVEAERLESRIPGVAVVVVSGDRTVHLAGYGLADCERKVPVDPDRTVFRVGSVSKTLTALAVLQQVERGSLDLQTDVNGYLEDMQLPATFGPVTAYHLLTHTAGFDERLLGQHVGDPDHFLPLAEYLSQRLPPRRLPPGLVISYNDHGTALAGYLVECTSGLPFESYMDQNVFLPLGMVRTSFRQVDLPEELLRDHAVAYSDARGDRAVVPIDYILTTPAAGLRTTAADMARFLHALLDPGGGETVSESARQAMLTRQFVADPLVDGRGFGFATRTANGERCFYKDGQASGFSARLFVLPDQRFGIFSVHNLSIFGLRFGFGRAASFHRRLHEAILDRYFPPPAAGAPTVPASAPDPERDLSLFAGVYRDVSDPRGTFETAMIVNEMRVVDNGDGSLRIGDGRWTPASEDGSHVDRFQWSEGGPYYRVFAGGADGAARFLFVGGGAYERIGFFETRAFRTWTLIVCLAIFAFTLPVVGVRQLVARRRTTDLLGRARFSDRLPLLVALLSLGFAAGLAITLLVAEPQRFLFQAPGPAVALVFTLGVLAAFGTVLLVIRTVVAWRRRERGLWLATIVALTATVNTVVLYQMNLLGYRF